MAKLGVGIIGCGNISTSYLRLAPLFRSLDLKAVADIDMDAARRRVVVDQVASLTDGSAAAWHQRLC